MLMSRLASPATPATLVFRLVVGVAMAMLASASIARAQDSTPKGTRRVTWPVTKRALVTGDTVRESDIALLDTTIVWLWNSTPDTTRAVAGWLVRRPMAIGEVLRTPAIMAPPMVAAGATVSAIWQDGPLKLVLTGVATNTAPLGAPVGVRIDRSRRLDGVAIAPNTVRLR